MKSLLAKASALALGLLVIALAAGPISAGDVTGRPWIWSNPSNGADFKDWGMTAQYDDGDLGTVNTWALMALNDDDSNPALTDSRPVNPNDPLYGCNSAMVVDGLGAGASPPTTLPTDIGYMALGPPGPPVGSGCQQAYIDIQGDGGLDGTWGVVGEFQLWGTDPTVKYFVDNGTTPEWAEGISDYFGNPAHWYLYDMIGGTNVIDAIAGGGVDIHPIGPLMYKEVPLSATFRVEDSGPWVCDGGTDNSATLNTALAAFRLAANNGVELDLAPAGTNGCVVGSQINATELRSQNRAIINGRGAIIYCNTFGGKCWDGSGDLDITYRNLTIDGNSGAGAPDIGIQIARSSSGICGGLIFDNVVIYGFFNKEAFYNMQCEGNVYIAPKWQNSVTSGANYVLVMDGENHWNATSSFTTINSAVDSGSSFNENYFVEPIFDQLGTGSVMWIADASHMSFVGGYSEENTSTAPAVVLYDNGQGSNNDLDFDIHFEVAPSAIFLLSGSNASPAEYGLSYQDHYNESSTSIFALDTGVTAATLSRLVLNVPHFLRTPHVFDTPADYTVDGDVYVQSGSFWNAPASFSGKLDKGGSVSFWQGNLQLLPVLTGTTGSIGGSSLAAGACTSGTATVTGATTSMAASVAPVASPLADSTHGLSIFAFVSSSNTVTVEECALVATTPTARTFNVRVLQ